jgi:hypothetical protein
MRAALVTEAVVGSGPERGNQAADRGERRWTLRVTVPRTRAPRAPVAAERFRLPECGGERREATAWRRREEVSSKAEGVPTASASALERPEDGDTPAAEATTSVPRGVHRATAAATLRAVSSTAVATPSAPGTRA